MTRAKASSSKASNIRRNGMNDTESQLTKHKIPPTMNSSLVQGPLETGHVSDSSRTSLESFSLFNGRP